MERCGLGPKEPAQLERRDACSGRSAQNSVCNAASLGGRKCKELGTGPGARCGEKGQWGQRYRCFDMSLFFCLEGVEVTSGNRGPQRHPAPPSLPQPALGWLLQGHCTGGHSPPDGQASHNVILALLVLP